MLSSVNLAVMNFCYSDNFCAIANCHNGLSLKLAWASELSVLVLGFGAFIMVCPEYMDVC
jgi:hypothetical protein